MLSSVHIEPSKNLEEVRAMLRPIRKTGQVGVMALWLLLAPQPTIAKEAVASAPEKTILLLATGGTIAGKGGSASASYRSGVVPIADILRDVPGLDTVTNISAEQMSNVSSSDMDEVVWLKLVSRIRAATSDPRYSGVVITHGTSTMEETAYFLSLVVPSTKPIVLVGSMRPSGTLSADGPQNLMDAARVASADNARDHGVMIVMNDTIFEPISATKVDMHRVDAFAAPSHGPVGQVLGNAPVFFSSAVPHEPAFAVTNDPMPRVAIAYAFAGLRVEDVRAIAQGADGLIIAGVGAGTFSTEVGRVVRELTARGMPVVRTARQGSGDIWKEDAQAGERSDDALGTIAGRELTPAKARILLMVSLQKTHTRDELQAIFDRYGTTAH